MKQLILAAAAIAAFAGPAGAQTKTLPGEMKTATATVEAIEKSTREVTIKDDKGLYHIIEVPKDNPRFDAIKVGDKVTARYYDNIVLRVKAPGEKDTDSSSAALTRSDTTKPGATAATQRTITATITEIDPKAPAITFSGPHGWKYSSRVEDKAALAKVKVGDKVDIVWTEAVMISLDPMK